MTTLPTPDLLATRSPGFHGRRPASDEEIARAVRSRVGDLRLHGSVWGTVETALLRTMLDTPDGRRIGEPVLRALARRVEPGVCRWQLARFYAIRYDQPPPELTPLRRVLLGDPCPRCVEGMRAAAAQDVAAGRSAPSRPTATTTSAVTAGAAPARPPTRWWERVPDRAPTEVEDRQFLLDMARRYPRSRP